MRRLIYQESAVLHEFIGDTAKRKMEAFSSVHIAITAHPRPDHFIYGTFQTSITLASKSFRLKFKTHFKPDDLKGLTSMSKDRERCVHILRDLLKEYSNQVAGELSSQFQRWGEKSGIGLPIMTRGIDEMHTSDSLDDHVTTAYWLLTGKDIAFTVTANLELFDRNVLNGLEVSAPDDSGSIEIF